MQGKKEDKMGILKNVGRVFAIAGLSVSLALGTLCMLSSAGTTIAYEKAKEKGIEDFKATQEYEDLRKDELQKINAVRDELKTLEEKFENGEITGIEYQTQADEINKQIKILEKNLDNTLFEQSQNPAIVQTRKKLKNLTIASCVLGGAGLGLGVCKCIISADLLSNGSECISERILGAIYNLSIGIADDIDEAKKRRSKRALQKEKEKLEKQEEKVKKLSEKIKTDRSLF